jgi:hypothetical protein
LMRFLESRIGFGFGAFRSVIVAPSYDYLEDKAKVVRRIRSFWKHLQPQPARRRRTAIA